MGEVLHLGRADLAHAVAGHELERLRRACQGGQAGRGSLELFLPHMAALATLSGGLPEGLVSDCLRREKEAIGCESLDTGIVKRVLTELLPDEGKSGIAPIRPDIVGEAFVLAHLGNGQASDGQRAVLRAFADHPAEVAAVLVRCVQDFAPRGASAASAREAQDQERALDWLRAVGEIPDLSLALLLVVLDALPQETLALRDVAVEWQGRAMALLREQAAVEPGLRAQLAGRLNDFAVRLSYAGQREEALKIAAEAVAIRRELADANPDAFRPVLAKSLNNLAAFLRKTGQREEAIEAARESATLFETLFEKWPKYFGNNFEIAMITWLSLRHDISQEETFNSPLTDAALGLYLAAQTGAAAATTDLAKKLGKGAVDKIASLVKDRFAKDGQGAIQTLERLAQQPNDAKAQNAVRRRLKGLLDEDPAFAAAIEAIIGQVTIDQSVRQTATAGDNSTITQIHGSHITVGPKS